MESFLPVRWLAVLSTCFIITRGYGYGYGKEVGTKTRGVVVRFFFWLACMSLWSFTYGGFTEPDVASSFIPTPLRPAGVCLVGRSWVHGNHGNGTAHLCESSGLLGERRLELHLFPFFIVFAFLFLLRLSTTLSTTFPYDLLTDSRHSLRDFLILVFFILSLYLLFNTVVMRDASRPS